MPYPTPEELSQEFNAEFQEQLPFDFGAEYDQELGEMEAAAPGVAGTLARGGMRGLENIAAGVGAIYDWMGDITGIEAMQVGGTDAYEYWSRAAREGTFAPDPYIYRGTFMQNPSAKRALGIVAEALPSYGTALTVSVATGNPWAGAAMLGLLEGAPQYEEAREAGLSIPKASYYGLLSTTGTAMLEYLPISRLLGRAGGGFTRNLLQNGLEEGLQEVSQTLWQNYLAKVGYDDTRELAQGMIESFIGGAGSGGIAGGTTSKLNALAERAKNKGVTENEITELYDNLQKQVEAAAGDIENWNKGQEDALEEEYEDEQLREQPGGEIIADLKRGRITIEDAKTEVDDLVIDRATRDNMYDALNQVVIEHAGEELTPRDERTVPAAEITPQPAPYDIAEISPEPEPVEAQTYAVGDVAQTPEGEGTVTDAAPTEIPGEQTLQLTLADGNEVVFTNAEVAPPIPRETVEAFPEILTEQDIVGAPAAAEPIEEVSAAPIVAPGDRWQGDRGAMPGEPFLFLDGDAETGTAAIREIADDQGTVLYEAATEEGQPLGQFATVDEAAAAAEAAIPERPPSDLPAGQLTEDMQINEETLGQIEQRIIADEGVENELRAVIEERGRETFQDWLNPAKIGARLVSRLEQEGISRADAKAEIAPTMERYTEQYDAVLAEDKPPAEAAPEPPATTRILALGPDEFDQELNQLTGNELDTLGKYLDVYDPGMTVEETMFAIQDYYDEQGEKAPREAVKEAAEEEIITEAPPAEPEPEVAEVEEPALSTDETDERENLRERHRKILDYLRANKKARNMTLAGDTFNIREEVDRIKSRLSQLDYEEKGIGPKYLDREGNILYAAERADGGFTWYSTQDIDQAGEVFLTAGDPKFGSLPLFFKSFGEAQQELNRWASQQGIGAYAAEFKESKAYEGLDAYNPVLDPKEQSTAHAKNIARILKAHDIQLSIMRGEDGYYKIENAPYMDLVIERHLSPDGRNMALYLTHYFEEGGDLIMDTEMVYTIKGDGKLELRETAVRGPVGEMRQGPEQKKGADRGFATMFANNLISQGFDKGTLVDPKAEVAAEEAKADVIFQAGETVRWIDDQGNMNNGLVMEEYSGQQAAVVIQDANARRHLIHPDKVATDLGRPPDVISFRSGANREQFINGYADAGAPVGIELGKTPKDRIQQVQDLVITPLGKTSTDYIDKGGRVFVDSGAFPAHMNAVRKLMEQGVSEKDAHDQARGEVDFDDILSQVTEFIAPINQHKDRITIVAPDVIGDQDRTIELIEQNAALLASWVGEGYDIIFPIQKGDLTPYKVWQEYKRILNTDDFRVAVPSKVHPFTVEDFENLFPEGVAEQPKGVHLLGMSAARGKYTDKETGIVDPGYRPREAAIRKGNPQAIISTDAVRHLAKVGAGRPISEMKKEIAARMEHDFDIGEAAYEMLNTPGVLTDSESDRLYGWLSEDITPEQWQTAREEGGLYELVEEAEGLDDEYFGSTMRMIINEWAAQEVETEEVKQEIVREAFARTLKEPEKVPRLSMWGLEVNPGQTKAGAPTFEVTGNTKIYKDVIKAVSGRKWFNGKKAAWVFTVDPTEDLVDLLEQSFPREVTPAEGAPAAEPTKRTKDQIEESKRRVIDEISGEEVEEAAPAAEPTFIKTTDFRGQEVVETVPPAVEQLENLEDRLNKFGTARLLKPLSGNPIDYKILERDIRGNTVYVYTKTQDGVRVTKGGAVPGWAQDKAIGEAVRDAEIELGLSPGQQPAAEATPAEVSYAERYWSPQQKELTAREAEIRQTVYDLKDGHPTALATAAAAMAPLVTKDDILVPMPSSKGLTEDTGKLAEMIAVESGSTVSDVLTRKPTEGQLERRKKGLPGRKAEELGIELKEGVTVDPSKVVFIDNLVTSGETIKAAQQAVGGGRAVTYAKADEVVSEIEAEIAPADEYPKAGEIVDGRTLLPETPNIDSIEATFGNEYEILPYIREVPLSDFEAAPKDLFYAADDFQKVRELAENLKGSKTITPLIVVVGAEGGPYVLEGAHRLGALHEIGAKSFPALVVRDLQKKSPLDIIEAPVGKEEDRGLQEPVSAEPTERQAEAVSGVEGERQVGELPEREGGERERPGERPGGEGEPVARGEEPGTEAGAPTERERPAATRGDRLARTEQPSLEGNYRITSEDELEQGGPVAKYEKNVVAIKLLKQIEQEGRNATPEEQAILVKYTGWGGLPDAFAPYPKDQWRGRKAELEELLTEEEYESARASTPNAHYTSPALISSIWSAIQKMGFKQGRVLEPSMGIGHFFGMIPADIKATLTGVEIDDLSGRISKQLYQAADVRVEGYEEAKLPDNFYDLVVSNIPFGDYKPYDPKFNKFKFPIHDYFFAKSLDKVRPGGMVVFITSKFTMDKKLSAIREYMGDRAELVGALRLPSDTFKGIANTEVVTDAIFLRKLDEGEQPTGPAFKESKVFRYKSQGIEYENNLNEYYHEHPGNMLGDIVPDEMQGFRGSSIGLKGRPGFEQDIENAIDDLAGDRDIFAELQQKKAESRKPEDAEIVPPPESVKDGALFVEGKKVYRKKGDARDEVKVTKSEQDRISKMIQLRDSVRTLLLNQLEGRDDSFKGDLAQLNKQYNAFVKKYGNLHKRPNVKAFQEDPDGPLLLSLEKYNSETKKVTKTDIFTKRTMARYQPVESADNAQDALVASLFDRGTVDLDHMSRISAIPTEQLQQELTGLIFNDPEGGKWITADEYLSGNVRTKLDAAIGAAQVDQRFKPNVEALEKVQPVDLGPGEIKPRLGAPWLPNEVVNDFINELVGTRYTKANPRFIPQTGSWVMDTTQSVSVDHAKDRRWSTADTTALKLIDGILNMRQPEIKRKDSKGNKYVDHAATALARAKQQEISERFTTWAWEDGERAKQLKDRYNQEFNNTRLRQYDGSHIDKLPGMNDALNLHSWQKDAIWRIVHGKNVTLGHVVGSGKTFSIIGGAMELRRLGLAEKPMIVVPKHLLLQWKGAFLEMYPAAKILVPDQKDFTPAKRKEFMARIATGDWDSVIVTVDQFGRLPMSKKAQADFIREQISELEVAKLAEAAEGDRGSKVVKELEKAKKRLETKLKTLLAAGEKDTTVTFEELGVDYIFSDESHRFKRLFFTTRMQRVAGISSEGSDRATDMYLKSQYLTKLNNGRGVVFATGTPISNTMAEMYTLMRYMNTQALKDLNIHNFDAWAHAFGQLVTGFEVTPTGEGFRQNTRFSRFVNLPELQNLFRAHTDVVLHEDTDLPLPKIRGGKATVHSAPISPEQQDYVNSLVHRMEAIRAGRVNPKDDNALVVTGDGRKSAIDMRLIDETYEDNAEGKVNMASKEIVDIYKRTKKDKATQLVFIDFSTPSKDKFNVYHDLKAKLVELGVKENEISFIHDHNTDIRKQTIFDKMNSGSVRILLGSTAMMGEGMNVQARLYAEHHIDAPWRPSDIEQREGRILRQGNMFEEVEIHRYVTEGTFDAYMWQTLENKAKFIGQVMQGIEGMREAEDVGPQVLSYAEVKAIASGNPLVMEKLQIDSDLQAVGRLKADFDTRQRERTIRLVELPKEISNYKENIAKSEKDVALRDKNLTEKKAELTLEGQTHNLKDKDDRKAARKHLLKIGKKIQAQTWSHKTNEKKLIGSYLGFSLSMNRLVGDDNPVGVLLEGTGNHWIDLSNTASYTDEDTASSGWVQRIENKILNLENRIQPTQNRLEDAETELKSTVAQEEETFEQQEELDRLTQESDRITKIIEKDDDVSAPLSIQTGEGEVAVTGERIGEHIAVHISVGQEDEPDHNFTVSHLPTGLSMAQNLNTKEGATDLANALNATDIDWSFTDMDALTKEEREIAGELVREHRDRDQEIFEGLQEKTEQDEPDPEGGTTLYSGFPLQELARVPKLFHRLLTNQKMDRIGNWYNWLRGRTDESIDVVLQKDYGPQLGWWFRNMDSIMSQTRQGRVVYEAGRNFKQDTIKQFKVWTTRYERATDGLSDTEKREVLNLVDQVESPEGEGKVVEAAQKIRQLTIDVRQYLIDNGHKVGYIEGYLPHIFQGHFWVKARGQMSHKVDTIGEALEVAERMTTETGENVTVMQDTFVPPDDAMFLSRRAYWRLIKTLQDKAGESIEVLEDLSTTEIHQMISGAKVARPLPRKRFFGNMVKRVVNNPNFVKDLDTVMQGYFYGASRKVHQDLLMKKISSAYEKMPSTEADLKKFIEAHYMPGLLAHPTIMEKAMARAIHEVKLFPGASGQDVRRWMHNVNLIQYVMDLGLSMSSAIANASQFFLNTYAIVGEKAAAKAYSRAAKIMTKMLVSPEKLTEEQRADLKEITEMGITSSVSSITGEIIIEEGTVKEFVKKIFLREGIIGFQEATLMPFSTVELQNRFASYFAGKFWAENQLAAGKSAVGVAREVGPETSTLMEIAQEIDERLASTEATRNIHWQRKQARLEAQFARLSGVEINDKTQFRVGRENLPFILREAPIRLFSPYKTFLMNQLKFTIDSLRPKGIRTNPKKALRFAGMTLALAGVAGNPIVYGAFLAINRMLKELFDYDLEEELRRKNLRRGLTGYLGLDISGAVAVWLPDRFQDLLGRFGKIALELGKLAFQEEKGAGFLGMTTFQERMLKRQVLPAQVQRTLDAITIIDEGQYVTPLSKTPVALTQEPYVAAIKRFIGMLPESVSRTFEEEQQVMKAKRRFKTLSRDLTERWAQAIKENDQGDMDDVMQLVVRRVDKALKRLKKGQSESTTRKALVELLFWKSWIGQQNKFKRALEKKYIPRQLEKPLRVPTYLKPEAFAGVAAALPKRTQAAAAPVDRATRLAEFRKSYIRAPNMSARVSIKKKVAKWNARHKRAGQDELVIPWAEVAKGQDGSSRVKKPTPPPPSSRPRGGGLLRHRPQL